MADDFASWSKTLGTPEDQSLWKNPFGYAANFALNIPYGLLDLGGDIEQNFGVENGPFRGLADQPIFDNVDSWKAQNPVSGLASDFAGFFLGGGGWLKATKGAKWVTEAAKLGGSSGLGRYVAAEGARWAPFNLGLTGAEAAAGHYSNPVEAAGDFALNTGFGLGASALVGKFWRGAIANYDTPLGGLAQSAAKRVNLRDYVADFAVHEPYELQLRKLTGALEQPDLTPEARASIESAILEGKRAALAREITGDKGYTSFPADKVLSPGTHFQKRFTPKSDAGPRGSNVYKLTHGQDVVPGVSLESVIAEAQLPKDFEMKGSLYRYERPRSTENAAQTMRFTDAYMTRVDDNLWMTQEPGEGMWIFTRVLPQPKGKPTRFLHWKTDLPGEFSPKNELYRDMFAKELKNRPIGPLAWDDVERTTAPGGHLFEKSREAGRVLPLEDLQGIVRSKDKGTLNRFLDDMVARSPTTSAVRDWANRHIAPALAQFTDNARAARIHALSANTFDEAAAQTRAILNGTESMGASYAAKQVPFALAKGLVGELDQAIAADPGLMLKLHAADIAEQLPDQIADPNLRKLVEVLQGSAKSNIEDHNLTMKAIGGKLTKVRENHLGISRQWSGNFLQAIRDETGAITGIAQGNSRGELARNAQRLLERDQAATQKALRIAEQFSRDGHDAPADLKKLFSLSRGFQNPRGKVTGFDHDLDPYTKEEFLSLLERNYSNRGRLTAEATTQYLHADELARLAIEDRQAYDTLTQRLKLMGGDEGKWAEVQNAWADAILSPIFGGEKWASKIAQTTNRLMLPLQLGAGLISYPISNLASLAQMLPAEISFFKHAAPESIARYYQWFPVFAKDGVKPLGKINEFAVMSEAMRQLRKPDPLMQEFLERAKFDGTADPRFIEDFIGQKDAGEALKNLMKGPKEFVTGLETLSAFPAAYTEKKLRNVLLANAYVLLGKLGRVAPEELSAPEKEALYQTMKTFVDRGSFRYAREDRPLLFTTPAGQVFGGFKNWMMNYVYTMARFAGEAGRGNWHPLMWQTAGTAAVGGLAATPFLGDAADWFSEVASGKDVHDNIEANFGEFASDSFTYGLPAALGMNLSAQSSAPGSDFLHDVEFLGSVAALDRGANLSRALGGVWDNISLGIDPLKDPKVVTQLYQGLAPRSFYRAYQSIGEGPRSAGTGYEAIPWESQRDKVAYALGFTPADLQQAYKTYGKLLEEKASRAKLTSAFGAAFANAGSPQEQREVLQLAAMQGADLSAVLRSAQSRSSAAEKTMFGRAGFEDPYAQRQVN